MLSVDSIFLFDNQELSQEFTPRKLAGYMRLWGNMPIVRPQFLLYYLQMDLGKTDKPRRRKYLWVITLSVIGIGLLAGGYVALNMAAPALAFFAPSGQTVADELITQQPQTGHDRLYLPSINIDIAVGSTTRDANWQSKGNPVDGGEFTLAAHHLSLRMTPSETRSNSPFYDLGKLHSGDKVFVDWAGTRYAYEVTDADNLTDRLTLRATDTNQTVTARPIGTVKFEAGQKPIIELKRTDD